ncbi:MAG: hypothetical protein ACM34K_12740 [Bacillota bacterium]
MNSSKFHFNRIILIAYCVLVVIGELALIISRRDTIPGALFVILSMILVSAIVLTTTRKRI